MDRMLLDRGEPRKQRGRAGELARLGLRPWLRLARHDTLAPAIRQKLVEEDEHPAQAEQWIERPQARGETIPVAAIDGDRSRAKARRVPRGERRARMMENIGHELHRIIPTEIFEVEKRERSVGAAQTVVEAEIRWHQVLLFLWEESCEVKFGRRHVACGTRQQRF